MAGEALTYTEEAKLKLIKKEVTRLRKLYKTLPKDRQAAVEGLIHEAAFMRATMDEARQIINREGVLENFEQGKQKLLREHPAAKIYTSLVQRYATVCKQLVDLLPDGEPKAKAGDALLDFLKQGRR